MQNEIFLGLFKNNIGLSIQVVSCQNCQFIKKLSLFISVHPQSGVSYAEPTYQTSKEQANLWFLTQVFLFYFLFTQCQKLSPWFQNNSIHSTEVTIHLDWILDQEHLQERRKWVTNQPFSACIKGNSIFYDKMSLQPPFIFTFWITVLGENKEYQ